MITITEIILAIGLIVSGIIGSYFAIKLTIVKANNTLLAEHNKTLYDLYCQNHRAATGLLDTLNKNIDNQNHLNRKVTELSVELSQEKFRGTLQKM